MPDRFRFATAVLFVASAFPTSLSRAADGYFDTSWRNSGHFIVYPADVRFAELDLIRTEPAEKLLLVGRFDDGATSAAIWWLSETFASGAVVPTFGLSDGSGFTTSCQLGLACNSVTDLPADALVQTDGKYLVLSGLELSRTTALAHALDSAGVVGGTGHVDVRSYLINDVQGKLTNPRALALLADGKILVAGEGLYSGISTSPGMAVLRLNSDLSLDTGFHAIKDSNQVTFAGGNVVAVDPADVAGEIAKAIVVQPDGSMLLVGDGGGVNTLEVARLNADGSLDTSYGNSIGGGKYPITDLTSVSAIAAPFGRIIVGVSSVSDPGFSILRISEDGVTYASYSQLPAGCVEASVTAVSCDSAGRILATGTCVDAGSKTHFLALRLRGDTFSLDPSFGNNGISLGWFDGSADFSSSLPAIGVGAAIDSAGKPVIGGFANTGVVSAQAGIARLTYDLIFANRMEPPAGCLPPNCN